MIHRMCDYVCIHVCWCINTLYVLFLHFCIHIFGGCLLIFISITYYYFCVYLYTVFPRIVRARSINFTVCVMRGQFEGVVYSRARSIRGRGLFEGAVE